MTLPNRDSTVRTSNRSLRCSALLSGLFASARALRLAACLVFALSAAPVMAWNKPGHMTTAAIAFIDLEAHRPSAQARALEMLRAHSRDESLCVPTIKRGNLTGRTADLHLFIAAARWPDDMRDTEHHIPLLRHVNILYKPVDHPASLPTKPADRENIFVGSPLCARACARASPLPPKRPSISAGFST